MWIAVINLITVACADICDVCGGRGSCTSNVDGGDGFSQFMAVFNIDGRILTLKLIAVVVTNIDVFSPSPSLTLTSP